MENTSRNIATPSFNVTLTPRAGTTESLPVRSHLSTSAFPDLATCTGVTNVTSHPRSSIKDRQSVRYRIATPPAFFSRGGNAWTHTRALRFFVLRKELERFSDAPMRRLSSCIVELDERVDFLAKIEDTGDETAHLGQSGVGALNLCISQQLFLVFLAED